MDKISIIYPYYRQPGMLKFQVETWESYSDEVKDQLNFVVLDDGSPEPMRPIESNLDISWYRINENITWNQGGVRNLGAHVCKTDYMWLGYIDYVWTEDNLRKLLALERRPDRFYRFLCLRADTMTPQHPEHHPIGTPFMNTKTFWEVGGLDEDFSGHYGAEDNVLFWRLTRDPGGIEDVILDSPHMVCYTPSCGPSDAIIMEKQLGEGWERNNERNRKLLGDKRQKRVPWSTDHLRFTWKQL